MAKLTIIGNDKPVIGTEEMYSVSSINDWLHPNNNNPFKPPMKPPVTKWGIMVLTKNGWVRTPKNDKEKLIAPYKFSQKSLLHKSVKIVVERGSDIGELIVQPQRAKEPKITKVELLDTNYKPIPKGKKLSYKDTIIARAHCVEMFKMNVSFTLWEDDAKGEGHDPIVNAFNKINVIPIIKPVNQKGIAEAIFRLPAYTMAVQIANARIAAGDKNEGKTHEYYVTADVVDKKLQKASPNVNVDNPTYNPKPPKRERPKTQTPSPAKPKQPTPPANKPKPKPDSAKFPVTSTAKSSSDSQGKILSAEFVDNNGNRLHSSKVGQTVRIKIVANKKKDEKIKVKVKIWEEDNFTWTNDEIYNKDHLLIWNNNYINNVQLTKKLFDKANDGGRDGTKQDYFIEVIHNDTSVKSSLMPITLDAEPTKVPSGNSATEIAPSKQEKSKEGKCPNCDKPITLEQMKKIFPDCKDATKLKAVADTYNKYMKDLNMNTCWNKAHLFAQARVEAGLALNMKAGESFNYYYEGLSIFGAFQTKEGKEKAKLWGRPTRLPKLPGVSKEDQIKIANYAYSPPAKKAKELENTEPNDGWNYRGRGLVQVTGKGFYKYCNNYTKKNGNDVIANPDLIGEKIELAVLASMIFFKWKGINKIANNTRDVKGKICPLVGKDVKTGSKSNYNEKQAAFDDITSKVFQIDLCRFGKADTPKKKTGEFSTYDSKYTANSSASYIDVIVPTDRKKEGLLVFFDDKSILHQCYVLGLGTGGEDRYTNGGYGNVPNGLWNTKQELNVPNSKGQAYPNSGVSFGNHGTIRLSPKEGDALNASKRSGILLHCGHTIGDGKTGLTDNGALMVTHGCLRVYNKDMPIIQKFFTEQINKGKKVYIYVEETSDLNTMFTNYGTKPDPKDTVIRKNKKYDPQ